jgi:membrane associated rhomboid family serine protease
VYGGFGIAVGVVLLVATASPALRPGVYVALAAALGGMAGGRLVAAVVERPRGFYPCWFYCLAEMLMAAVLVAAM